MQDERSSRNSVFNPSQVTSGGVPMMSQAEKLKQDFGLDIPSELVPVPSKGKLYAVGHPLCNAETVEIKAMTTKEEDILTSKALLKNGTVLDELIKSCLIDKTIDPLYLLSSDRSSLMVAIRVTGYGADYTAEVTCAACEEKAKQTFDLSSLPIKTLEIEPLQQNTNQFAFQLPYTKKNVVFKFLTGVDEKNITAEAAAQKKLGQRIDSGVTSHLIKSIISIDGIEDRNKINAFIKAMPAKDSTALRKYISDNTPGIQMTQTVTCPLCGAVEEVGIPITAQFLHPSIG